MTAMVGVHPNVEEARFRAGQTLEQQREREEKRTRRSQQSTGTSGKRAYAARRGLGDSDSDGESEDEMDEERAEERRLAEALVNRDLNASHSQQDTTADDRHSDHSVRKDWFALDCVLFHHN